MEFPRTTPTTTSASLLFVAADSSSLMLNDHKIVRSPPSSAATASSSYHSEPGSNGEIGCCCVTENVETRYYVGLDGNSVLSTFSSSAVGPTDPESSKSSALSVPVKKLHPYVETTKIAAAVNTLKKTPTKKSKKRKGHKPSTPAPTTTSISSRSEFIVGVNERGGVFTASLQSPSSSSTPSTGSKKRRSSIGAVESNDNTPPSDLLIVTGRDGPSSHSKIDGDDVEDGGESYLHSSFTVDSESSTAVLYVLTTKGDESENVVILRVYKISKDKKIKPVHDCRGIKVSLPSSPTPKILSVLDAGEGRIGFIYAVRSERAYVPC